VTLDRRPRAVVVLQERFGVSERRACRVVGQHRSTQSGPARPMPTEDEKLRRELRRFARRHPRLGWRKAHDVLRREGWTVNHKRLRRLWREEGLRRPPPRRAKQRRPGTSDGVLLRAEAPNQVWVVDFQFDETADQRRLKMLSIVDEHTREALAMEVDRATGTDQVVAVIERLVRERSAPGHLRMDNGPELIAWALRDWCRLTGTSKGCEFESHPRSLASSSPIGWSPSLVACRQHHRDALGTRFVLGVDIQTVHPRDR